LGGGGGGGQGTRQTEAQQARHGGNVGRGPAEALQGYDGLSSYTCVCVWGGGVVSQAGCRRHLLHNTRGWQVAHTRSDSTSQGTCIQSAATQCHFPKPCPSLWEGRPCTGGGKQGYVTHQWTENCPCNQQASTSFRASCLSAVFTPCLYINSTSVPTLTCGAWPGVISICTRHLYQPCRCCCCCC
jgi:hypothetical protein